MTSTLMVLVNVGLFVVYPILVIKTYAIYIVLTIFDVVSAACYHNINCLSFVKVVKSCICCEFGLASSYGSIPTQLTHLLISLLSFLGRLECIWLKAKFHNCCTGNSNIGHIGLSFRRPYPPSFC